MDAYVPARQEVRETLEQVLGGVRREATAVELCEAMIGRGWDKRSVQIAMSRAIEWGEIELNADWSLS